MYATAVGPEKSGAMFAQRVRSRMRAVGLLGSTRSPTPALASFPRTAAHSALPSEL